MSHKYIHPDRVLFLNKGFKEGKYVLYWMSQSMRISYNHALEFAILEANKRRLPLVVFFGINNRYLNGNLRHYHFLLKGVFETFDALKKRGIHVVFRLNDSVEVIKEYLLDAQMLVMDYGYLEVVRKWRKEVYEMAKEIDIDCFMVESDVVVPVKKAYDKAAYGAYILRHKLLGSYLSYVIPYETSTLNTQSVLNLKTDDYDDLDHVLKLLDLDESVGVVSTVSPGYHAAKRLFSSFLKDKMNLYSQHNDPSKDYVSYMSIYLHFGQISSVELIIMMNEALHLKQISKTSYDMYLEQLLVRRELAFNYVLYQKGYDQFETMTEKWAYETMNQEEKNKKEFYTLKQIEDAKTHDIYFNAAMNEMKIKGYMKGYMRMYWAKKIIEWTKYFKDAYNRILYLNNKYFLDGRDPNSYAGVAWCFGKHDRAFFYKEGFGKLRYMNDNGLKKKFEIDHYVHEIKKLQSDKKD